MWLSGKRYIKKQSKLTYKILKRVRSNRPDKMLRKMRLVWGLTGLARDARWYIRATLPYKMSSAVKVTLENVSAYPICIFYIASWSSGVLASLSHWRSRVRSPSKLPLRYVPSTS